MDNKEVELKVLIEEYKTLREEIISDQNASFSNTTTTLATLTAVLSIIAALKTPTKPFWVAFTPMLFFVLNLYQLRLGIMTANISHYIAEVLSPRIKKLSPGSFKSYYPFEWEESARTPWFSNNHVFKFVEAARFGLQLFLALAVTLFYFSLVYVNFPNELNLFDYVISIINVVGIIISGLIILYVRKKLREKPIRGKKRH